MVAAWRFVVICSGGVEGVVLDSSRTVFARSTFVVSSSIASRVSADRGALGEIAPFGNRLLVVDLNQDRSGETHRWRPRSTGSEAPATIDR